MQGPLHGEQSISLQGIGRTTAIPAEQVEVGMCLLWNYGGTSKERQPWRRH